MSVFSHPVVAVGASAGGIEALKTLVANIPADTQASFVVLQHLSPDHDSQLVSILARSAHLPVSEASADTVVEPGHIYVMPPDRYLRIVDHGLLIDEPSAPRGSRMPIDHFMRSLADAAGQQAFGVILSGTGSDGTLGMRAIKGAGGLTFAQSPETALYDGMPRAAIDGDNADQVGTIDEICKRIVHLAAQSWEDVGKDFKRADLQAVLTLQKSRLGMDFSAYKTGTVGRRIRRRMSLLRLPTLGEYLQHLRSDAAELSQLSADMLINVTSFFRDEAVWDEVAKRVVQPLVETVRDRTIRIWVPGCSSGEEAYTLAMLFEECCATMKRERDWQIFATDLDQEAVHRGREALYPSSIAADLSEARLRRFFRGEDGGYRVDKSLRERVVFAQQNILTDPPFSRIDLLSCRNLMIYLETEHQRQLLETFHFALNDDGFLILGTSESVPTNSRLFKPAKSMKHIYVRKPGHSHAQFTPRTKDDLRIPVTTRLEKRAKREQVTDLGQQVRRSLLERYAPAGAVIDGHGQILHYTGAVGRFIDTPEGQPSNNIFDILRAPLRARVRDAVRRAAAGEEPDPRVASVRFADGEQHVRVDCALLADQEGTDEPRYLVTFVEVDEPRAPSKRGSAKADDEYVRQLENELETVREDLQTTVEELETSNEELKTSHEAALSSNEQLQSANEELETGREELQSLNEELVTVNHQLEEKVAEVEKASDDLRNLLASTRLPVLFLDSQLNISSFTPTMRGLIEFRESDIGRPLSELAMKVNDRDLAADAARVIAELQPIERDVEDDAGRIYLRRLQPYRTSDQRIGGAVATFTDITEHAKLTRRLADRERQARIVAELGQLALTARDLQKFMDEVCGSLREALECDYTKILSYDEENDWLELDAGAGWKPGLVGNAHVKAERKSQGGYTLKVEAAVLVRNFEEEHRFESPPLLTDHGVRSGISTVITVGDRPWGVIGLHDRAPYHFDEEDLDILRVVANIISMVVMKCEREEFLTRERLTLSLALRVADMGVWTFDPQTGAATWDHKLRAITGLGSAHSDPQASDFMQHVHDEDRQQVEEALQRTVELGIPFDTEFRFFRPDGELIWLLAKAERVMTDAGPLVLGINADITARRRGEEQTTFMMRELDHRVKNLLSVILSICEITSRNAGSIEAFIESFTSRLKAMARTHSLLAQRRWAGTSLRELLAEEVRSSGLEESVEVRGPDVSVSPSAAQSLSMLFHELTTNAIKYGALSAPQGKVEISWKRRDEFDGQVQLSWVERGGPAVSKPSRTGFGTKVIDQIVRNQLNSDVEINWPETGLELSLTLPVEQGGSSDKDGDGDRQPVSHEVLADKNVMVLDDEWLIAEQNAHVLDAAGARVVGPFTRLEPALQCDPEQIDIAVLDYALDGGDVMPLARKLNAAGVPIVFITGYGASIELPSEHAEDLIIAKPAGASAVLDSTAWLLTRNRGARARNRSA